MVIYIGADHRGFNLKEQIKVSLQSQGYTVHDMGAEAILKDDDYIDYAKPVCEKVAVDVDNSRGILVCGSGVGMDMAANKFPGILSALVSSPDQAMASRDEDNTNVLSLAAEFIDIENAKRIVGVWLQTPFSNEDRYKRRLDKIKTLDNPIN